jgi:hypothetical protein
LTRIWSVLALAAAGALGSSHILAAQGPAYEDWTGFLGGPERRATVSGAGLLKTWPTNGPVMVWESRAIGVSMGEVLIVGSNVYAWGQTLPEPERDTDKSQEAAAGAPPVAFEEKDAGGSKTDVQLDDPNPPPEGSAEAQTAAPCPHLPGLGDRRGALAG